jgi:hypothetical protein
LYVRHKAKTVGYVGQENRAAVLKYVSNAKPLQQIIQQVQYHLEGRFAVFYEILAKIKSHKFVLHGFLDKAEGQEGKHSESTDKIIKFIERHLNPENFDSITWCAQFIRNQLNGKTTPSKGSMFFGYGARDPSTATLHLQILDVLNRVLPEQTVAHMLSPVKIT